MSTRPKTQRAFLTVTVITVIAVTSVFLVYAAVLSTLYGSTVTVNQTGGSVEYNLSNTSNATWVSSLSAFNNGTNWYARMNITGAAAQAVTINWVIEKNTGTWTQQAIPVNTTITLAAGSNTIYATTTGVFSGNYNWGLQTLVSGSYRIKTVVNG